MRLYIGVIWPSRFLLVKLHCYIFMKPIIEEQLKFLLRSVNSWTHSHARALQYFWHIEVTYFRAPIWQSFFDRNFQRHFLRHSCVSWFAPIHAQRARITTCTCALAEGPLVYFGWSEGPWPYVGPTCTRREGAEGPGSPISDPKLLILVSTVKCFLILNLLPCESCQVNWLLTKWCLSKLRYIIYVPD